MTGSLADLLVASPYLRRRAIRGLAPSPALAFALRRVLFEDRDANVRAAAARRLGRLDGTALPFGSADGRGQAPAVEAGAVGEWLCDALGDGSPFVRDAILRSLARCGNAAAARTLVRVRIVEDRMWWVRRTAIYALAAIAGAEELPAFEAALADPFWRVRHAAIKVLAALGARDLEVRARIRDDAAPAETLALLRAAWGPVLVEAPQRAATRSQLPAELLDPDPAVVTARLASSDELASPVALVELLCDPHAPLRLLAAERIAASGDLAAYEAALDWLEEPRIPHVAETVERLLDGLGDPAATIAARALARTGRPGAARWAIAWTAATRYEAHVDAALARARADASLRVAALGLATIDDLVAWADATLIDPIATELHGRRSPAAIDALLQLSTTAHPRARALQVDAAAHRQCWELVERALGDLHHGPRAVATWWSRRAGRDVTISLADPDPAVREAALDSAHAPQFIADSDPWVARAAARQLDAADADDHAATAALDSSDPYIRAEACRLPIASERAFARVLALVIDPDEAVRSAAQDALAHVADLETRIAALAALSASSALGQASEPAYRVARAWLHGEQAPVPEREPRVPRARLARSTATPVARRPFGRLGFDVAPLVISGAYGLSPTTLAFAADAGVDLWFWEPAYHDMTRFLVRRPNARVIAGSYHAEPHAIEADVDRARRHLRRDSLDVFLLFWSRSPARIDREAFAALDALRRASKIGAVGFSTHDRALAGDAVAASPWDVVMTRHSAAHPGIERELLPAARERGTAILTFNTLCYGRMTSGPNAPTDAECIRYSLSQPGVTACINAPRRRAEVAARLAVLADPVLAPERIAELREHGIGVRAESQQFNTLLRQPTRDAAAAAREMLAADLPPRDEIEQRPLPRSSHARIARTNLGKTRRGGA